MTAVELILTVQSLAVVFLLIRLSGLQHTLDLQGEIIEAMQLELHDLHAKTTRSHHELVE